MTHPEPAPIIFIHGLFQGLDAPDAARSLSPMPVLAPDLPGYEEDRHHDPGDISLDAAPDAGVEPRYARKWDLVLSYFPRLRDGGPGRIDNNAVVTRVME